MVDYTTRIKLPRLDAGGGELQSDYPVFQRQFADAADLNAGAFVCTSGTRPNMPYIGQLIVETDTGCVYVWAGSWKYLSGQPILTSYQAGPTGSLTTSFTAPTTNGAQINNVPIGTYIVHARTYFNLASSSATRVSAALFLGASQVGDSVDRWITATTNNSGTWDNTQVVEVTSLTNNYFTHRGMTTNVGGTQSFGSQRITAVRVA